MEKSQYRESTKVTTPKLTSDKIKIMCGSCKHETNHAVLSHIHLDGSVEDTVYSELVYNWTDDHQIIQCQGCEYISFRKTHMNSNDQVYTSEGPEYQEFEYIFPNPEEGRKPLSDDFLLPQNLKRIYEETLISLNATQPILAAIGIRAIVETICKDKNASGSNLLKKIDDLISKGVLTPEGALILHKIRSMGNDAAHEVKPHNKVQLNLAMDVIDYLLNGVYILPHQVNEKFS